jgi:SAM-dependent methyltransferase/methyltransferase-like protein
MTEATQNNYDAVPYESLSFAQSHPARMSGMAKLFGLAAPPLATARVLELGCTYGGNLLPLALRYPDAQFAGVDFSQVQIERANRSKGELGATNATFRQADIREVAKESAQYDYIIAHGVYSWVPADVQDALLELIGRQLAPEGVAYVSYNVYPGWKMREVVREMMLFHVAPLKDPKDKLAQARAILQFASKLHANNPGAFGRLLAEEAEVLARQSDFYIFHEHLEPENRPCYFHEFVAAAGRHGLAYLGEWALADMLPERYGADLANTARRISGGNMLACEQYVDLLTNRAFRQTLLVGNRRAPAIRRGLTPDNIRNQHISVLLQPAKPAAAGTAPQPVVLGSYLDVENRRIDVQQPHAKALFDRLVAASPYAVPFEELVGGVAAFAQALGIQVDAAAFVTAEVVALLARGVATLYGDPVPRPAPATAQVSPYARWQAVRGNSVTNVLHGTVELTPEQRSVVAAGGVPPPARVPELTHLGVMV